MTKLILVALAKLEQPKSQLLASGKAENFVLISSCVNSDSEEAGILANQIYLAICALHQLLFH